MERGRDNPSRNGVKSLLADQSPTENVEEDEGWINPSRGSRDVGSTRFVDAPRSSLAARLESRVGRESPRPM